eukprot:jgi/Chlat1/779/Chrsp104S01247
MAAAVATAVSMARVVAPAAVTPARTLTGRSTSDATPRSSSSSSFIIGTRLPHTHISTHTATASAITTKQQTVSMTSLFEKSNPFVDELKETAAYIGSAGKGILASDESNATTGKRLATIGMDNTPDNRRDWRELLYTAPGLGQYISGAIMFDETLFQNCKDGTPFVDVLKSQGILPGIKVDTGLQPIGGTDGETATQGLDGLAERCQRYYKQGARFAKWRAVIKVDGDSCPTSKAILENAHGLARYAQICQENGLVPIVEPEVTLGEGDYGIERTAYVSELVNSHVFRLLNEYDIVLEGILLKPNMVSTHPTSLPLPTCTRACINIIVHVMSQILPGLDAPTASPEEVAKYTVRTMMRSVPAAVPSIHFLSGGMSAEESTLNLQALQAYRPYPWQLTFSYGRALQAPTLKAWAGEPGNVKAAQDMLVALAKANSEAQLGKYAGPHPAPGQARILQALRLGGAGK